MIRSIPLLAVMVLVSAMYAADDEKDALKKLEGTWEITSIEANGMKIPVGMGAPEKAVIADGKATFFSGDKAMDTFKDLELKLDPKNPKALDVVRQKNEILPCLYEVTDTEFKFAMPLIAVDRKKDDPIPRPESFETKGKAVLVLYAKREKKK